MVGFTEFILVWVDLSFIKLSFALNAAQIKQPKTSENSRSRVLIRVANRTGERERVRLDFSPVFVAFPEDAN